MSNIKKLLDILIQVNGDVLTVKAGDSMTVKTGIQTRPVNQKVITAETISLISREYQNLFNREEMISHAGSRFIIKESENRFDIVNLRSTATEVDGFSAESGDTKILNGMEEGEEKSLTVSLNDLLLLMKKNKASDLHLSTGCHPIMRIDGDIENLSNHPSVLEECLMEELKKIMPEDNEKEFEEVSDTDFAYELKGVGRFRTNVFRDINGVGAVFRLIPEEILTIDQLGIPDAFVDLCNVPKGLILVTGPTGSGKSTTLAALIDHINKNNKKHVITIEDPVEFVYKNEQSLINQREVNTHTKSFKSALRAALREDPDIILVGEMRDLETIAIAVEMAVTGHLVFGTLHTSTAIATVDRIIDQFPADRQAQIRAMLSDTLTGVCSQTLLKKKEGGRVGAYEILIGTLGVRNLIREGKNFQINTMMQTGKNKGMQTLNSALLEHVKDGLVEAGEALSKAVDKENMKSQLRANGFLENSGTAENHQEFKSIA